MGQKLDTLLHPPGSEAGPYSVAFADTGPHYVVQDGFESLICPASVTGVRRLQPTLNNLNGSYIDGEGLLLMYTRQELLGRLSAATDHGDPDLR